MPFDDEIVWDDQGDAGGDSIIWDDGPQESGIVRRAVGDTGISLAKGVHGLFKAGRGALGIMEISNPAMRFSNRAYDYALDKIGYDPQAVDQTLEGLYSPEQQAANRKVQEAEGFVDTAGEMIRNPSTIYHSAAESAPSMLAGGAVGRIVTKAAPFIQPLVSAAIGEGLVSAAQTAEDIRQQTPDKTLTIEQAGMAAMSGVGTGAFSLAGGRLAQKLGFGDIDTMLAAGSRGVSRQGVIKRIVGGGISEGVFEELPQSVQEQIWQNAATGKPLTEGIGEAGAQGMLAGGLMGVGGGVMTRHVNDDADLLDPSQKSRSQQIQEKYIGAVYDKLNSGEWTLLDVQEDIDRLADDDPLKPVLVETFMNAYERPSTGISMTGPNVYGTASPLQIQNQEAMDAFMGPQSEYPMSGQEPAAAPAPPPALGGPTPAAPPRRTTGAGITLPRMPGISIADETRYEPEMVATPLPRKEAPIADAIADDDIVWDSPDQATINQLANAAATSPANDIPQPTHAQKEAGNYRKGHIRVHGLDVSIENPEGSTRSGTSPDGKPWQTTMREGIQLPLNYNPAETADSVQVTPEQAHGILMGGNPLKGTNVTITTGKDILVPQSRLAGGRYFLDDQLRSMVDRGDFETRGEHMRAHITDGREKDVINRVYELGDSFVVARSAFEQAQERLSTLPSTEAPKISEITATDVVESFKMKGIDAQRVGKLVRVKTASKYLYVDIAEMVVNDDEAAIRMGYGREASPGEQVAGSFKNLEDMAVIKLKRSLADQGTLEHELWHFVKNAGVLKPLEIAAIERAAGKDEEAQARWVESALRERASHTGIISRALKSIGDFLDALINLFHATQRGILRKMESGEFLKRDSMIGDVVDNFSTTAGRWYSQMQQVLENKLPGSGTPEQMKTAIQSWANKGEFKAEELEWSGLAEWLDQQDGKVTRQQVLDYLDANHVRVQEVEKSTEDFDPDAQAWTVEHMTEDDGADEVGYYVVDGYSGEILFGPYENEHTAEERASSEYGPQYTGTTKFSKPDLQLPGGENYRELLLTLPGLQRDAGIAAKYPFKLIKYIAGNIEGLAYAESRADAEEKAERFKKAGYDKVVIEENRAKENVSFRSSHWDEPNVLAHVRFNERTGPNGERVLFIEEVQSDWHQKGRKEGYGNKKATFKIEFNDETGSWDALYFDESGKQIGRDGGYSFRRDAEDAARERVNLRAGVPDAPFKKTWPMLAMKRMVRYAAENGFDSIAWTPGDVQAERYDLRKYLGRIEYEPILNDDNKPTGQYEVVAYDHNGNEAIHEDEADIALIENTFGKEIAEKVQNGEGEDVGGAYRAWKRLDDLDLAVGSKGMKGFYDKILPAEVNKFFGKKVWGNAKVGTTEIQSPTMDKQTLQTLRAKRAQLVGEQAILEKLGSGMTDAEFTRFKKQRTELEKLNERIAILEREAKEAWSLPITPEMKQKALREGMPLFATRTPNEEGGLKSWITREKNAAIRTLVSKLPRNMPALTMVEQILKSPEWYDHPVIKKIVRFAIDRHDLFYENFNEINQVTDPQSEHDAVTDATQALKTKGLNRLQILKGQTSKEFKQLQEMVDYGDTNGYEFIGKTLEQRLQRFEEHFRKKGFSEDAIKVWRLHREAYDTALDKLLAPMRALEERSKERAFFAGFPENNFDKFMSIRNSKGEKSWLSLPEVIAEMESWRGFYAPRIRDAGQWVVKAAKGVTGREEFVRYHRTTRLSAERLAEKLKADGYHGIRVEENTSLGEDVLQHVKTMATAELLDKAAENIVGGAGVSAEAALRFHDELVTQVADLIRARGFRSTMIHRKEGSVIRGYIEDPMERFVRYAANTASGLTKAETAFKMTETFFGKFENGERVGGIQADKEPRAYGVAQKYIMEQLRNADSTDRVVGIAKALTTIKYLGFNPRAAFVNMTSMITTVPAALRQYATGGNVSFAKIGNALARAGKDYALFMKNGQKGSLSEQEYAFLNEIKTNHYDDPQYTRDSIGLIRGVHGKGFAKTMNWAMYLFGKTEQWNRGATMLAAYRMAEGGDAAKKDAARTVTEKAHGVYGRATLPAWAQGSNPAAKVGQMIYVYQKFGHNWLQLCYDLGFKKKDIKSFAWAFGSPIILGGAASIPLKSALVAIIGAIMSSLGDDRDPEKIFWDSVRENLGDTAEQGLRYGVSGLMGVDISGSLSFDPTLSRDIADYTGAIGGMVRDIATAGEMLATGRPMRAAETLLPTVAGNVVKAAREAAQGATTMRGNRVFDERNRPYMPTAMETGLKAAGFRSSRRATVQSRSWEARKQVSNFKDRREEIYEGWKAYITSRDPNQRRKVIDKIRQYNIDIRRLKLFRQIPFITEESLLGVARRMKRPQRSYELQ